MATTNPHDPGPVEEDDVRSVPKRLLFEDDDLVDTREERFTGVDEVLAFPGGGSARAE